jgi:hypothetical protein
MKNESIFYGGKNLVGINDLLAPPNLKQNESKKC